MATTQQQAQPARGADPAQVDPKHYRVQIENEKVRVVKINYGPGEKSVMHSHPACVGVFATDARFRFTYPDGRNEEIVAKTGDALYLDAFEHLPENLSTSPFEATLVELKVPASLGEQIGEERGRVTGTRVLSEDEDGPRIEVSFQSAGKTLGIESTDTGTYIAVLRPDGTLFGEGQGVLMTRDGESATWRGQGVGKLTGQGSAARWRGAIFYRSASPKLQRLNSVAAIFEYETDAEGNTSAKLWEWR